jgi:hypothetical protein
MNHMRNFTGKNVSMRMGLSISIVTNMPALAGLDVDGSLLNPVAQTAFRSTNLARPPKSVNA